MIRLVVPGDPSFYSPGRVKLLLWQYHDLVQLTRGVASPEVATQRLPRETPEGGFETGAVLKADIDSALAALDPVVRRVVLDYYVRGYAAIEIAVMVPGANRWFVDRARHRGIRQMALSLNWQPRKVHADGTLTIELDDDAGLSSAGLRERMRMVVSRAFSVCPKRGPPGYSCPVIDCDGFFDQVYGDHCSARVLEVDAAA